MDPSAVYRQRADEFRARALAAERASRRVANARLVLFVFVLAAVVFALRGSAWMWGPALALGLVFAFAIRMHARIIRAAHVSRALEDINLQGIARSTDGWHAFTDRGEEFIDRDHRFSLDLDVFGQGSVFQWMNTARTAFGRRSLARRLSEPPRDPTVIAEDQASVRELARLVDWRQRLEALAGQLRRDSDRPESFIAWAETPTSARSWIVAAALVLSPLVLAALIVAAYLGEMQWGPAVAWATLHLVVSLARAKANYGRAEQARAHAGQVEAYADMLAQLEACPARSALLDALGADLRSDDVRGSEALQRLTTILDWLDVQRVPIVNLLLNALFLLDFQALGALDAWRRRNGVKVRPWLSALGEAEALASLAVIAHEHPEWTYPEVAGDLRRVVAEEAGHPLIPGDRRVNNPVAFEREGTVWIVTGSNMSGKSTYMRTLGVNLILAYAGGPVCARTFSCGRLDVFTSMRNADNLEKSVSSFYAELLRMKMIVEAARSGRPVLFLLDEIFRGTNSEDRHAGARIVLKKLSEAGALGIVSTHDLELGALVGEGPAFSAYHFAEHYVEGEIRFDYRLRPGVSQTRNALALMRMVGILEE